MGKYSKPPPPPSNIHPRLLGPLQVSTISVNHLLIPPAQVFTDRMHPWKTIASIATLGHDRFATSVARTPLVKAYDLRMPGSKVYTYQSTSPTMHQSTGHTLSHTVWAANLSRDSYISFSHPQLCTGSSFGKSLYASLLGQVAELDFWDKTPEVDKMELSGYTFHQNTGIFRKLECRRGRGYEQYTCVMILDL